jgi:hypothetical protein
VSSTELVKYGVGQHPNSQANLIRKEFSATNQPREYNGGRPGKLDDPDFCDKFSKALAEGTTIKDLAEMFFVTEKTVQRWKHDMRVKVLVRKYIEDRVYRVHRKVDGLIENRLNKPDNLDTETLLKIRKEFLGGVMRMETQGGADDAGTINEAMSQLEKNPEFAEEFQALIEKHIGPTE